MTPSELQRYLHEHIPLTAAMEVKVVSCGPDAAHLSAPLPPATTGLTPMACPS
ncbi:MAG: YiiD C-terminal domain-containing protein [Akkermansiaceae bacterium]|nr:YiiD C-terminal domain-containing protein [Akkermansiaceae bacterium]